jgi:hypothetical protein
MADYEVMVSNIGLVYNGSDEAKAKQEYENYKILSVLNAGRAGGESVVLFCNGEPWEEFVGEWEKLEAY